MLRWICLLLGTLVLTSTLPAADPEPTLDGKPLAEWLDLLKKGGEPATLAKKSLYRLPDLTTRAMGPLVDSLLADEEPRRAINALSALGSPAVLPLARVLQRGEPLQKVAALVALGQMGRQARPAGPAVAVFLTDVDPRMRELGTRVLGRIDPGAADLLRPLLKDSEGRVQAAAIRSLMHLGVPVAEVLLPLQVWLTAPGTLRLEALDILAGLGPEAKPALPGLLKVLDSPDPEERRLTLECLFRMGSGAKDAIPVLQKILADPARAEMHLGAAQALWHIARAPEAVASFKAQAQDIRSPMRAQAALSWWITRQEPAALDVLVEIVQAKNARQAESALESLRQIGPPAARVALKPLRKLLEKAPPEQADQLLLTLGNFGEAAQPVADLVAERARAAPGENPLPQYLARMMLLQIRPDADSFKLFAEFLQSKDADVRAAGALRMADYPKLAEAALPALRKALDDPEGNVRLAAAVALWRLKREPRALEVAMAHLEHPLAGERSTAALELGYHFGADASPAVPAMIARLWDEDPFVRNSAAENLGRIGPNAKAAVPALIALLRDEAGDDLHAPVAEALGLIGPEAKDAIPLLKKRLESSDGYTRACAGLALWHIARDTTAEKVLVPLLDHRNFRARVTAAEALARQGEHPQALAVLLEVLRSTDFALPQTTGNVAFMAIRALGRIGPKAAPALPDIRVRLASVDPELHRAATDAIRQIEGK